MQSDHKLKVYSITMITVGLVIGLGIFRTATDSAQASLNPGIYFSAWILGGIIAICGALTFAEIGSRYPNTGGYYQIFAYAYHPALAFALNCVIIISNAAALAGVALIGSEYLSSAFPSWQLSDNARSMIAIGSIALFYAVNLSGLKISSRILNVLMAIKIGILLMLIFSLFFPHYHHPVPVPIQFPEWNGDSLSSLGAALIAICFTYGGYQQAINFGEEVDRPSHTLPRGIISGILIVLVLYLLVNIAYVKVIGFEDLKSAKGVAAIICGKLFGETGQYLIALLLFFAVLAYVDVMLLTNPRVMFAMSRDGALPNIFKQQNQKNVFVASLSVFTLLVIVILFFANTFEKLLGFTMFLDSIGMVFASATLFIFRKNNVEPQGANSLYKMKLFPLPTIIFIICYLFVTYTLIKTRPEMALTGTIVFLIFTGLYFIFKNKKS
ncbi:MAG: APC family permease [Saprospiraceae bacterium]|jgi:APA family basic amino acid/polyamine antiporter|nr:APC family permease [Saprospiraceae bacterium]